jgi:hypothetical protein
VESREVRRGSRLNHQHVFRRCIIKYNIYIYNNHTPLPPENRDKE